MNKIEVKILNPEVIQESEKMMVCGARLTQRGHNIKNLDDFMDLYNKDYKPETAKNMCTLSHATIHRFGTINVAVIGASRRFLAQITRHQAGVTFMSASLQYSDYSGEADFVVPYELLKPENAELKQEYLSSCSRSMQDYMEMSSAISDNDIAGYEAPQGLRNILIISANPLAWQHMITQRVCKRNTAETQYVMLKIWQALYDLSPMFQFCGPDCTNGKCREGHMSCKAPVLFANPTSMLKTQFPLLAEPEVEEWREITGWPHYKISSFGRVYSTWTNKILKATIRGKYPCVCLYEKEPENKKSTFHIHTLVAEAFIGPIGNLTVDHKDRDTLNPKVSNLRIVGHHEQRLNSAQCKPVAKCDIATGEIIEIYPSNYEAAIALGDVKKARNISHCACGFSKSASGFSWKHVDDLPNNYENEVIVDV